MSYLKYEFWAWISVNTCKKNFSQFNEFLFRIIVLELWYSWMSIQTSRLALFQIISLGNLILSRRVRRQCKIYTAKLQLGFRWSIVDLWHALCRSGTTSVDCRFRSVVNWYWKINCEWKTIAKNKRNSRKINYKTDGNDKTVSSSEPTRSGTTRSSETTEDK